MHEVRHDLNDPQPGHYKRRLCRGGPWVPAMIWWIYGDRDEETGELISDDRLVCQVGDEMRDPYAEWTWLLGQPITEDEHRKLTLASRAPGAPPAGQPIDFMKIEPQF